MNVNPILIIVIVVIIVIIIGFIVYFAVKPNDPKPPNIVNVTNKVSQPIVPPPRHIRSLSAAKPIKPIYALIERKELPSPPISVKTPSLEEKYPSPVITTPIIHEEKVAPTAIISYNSNFSDSTVAPISIKSEQTKRDVLRALGDEFSGTDSNSNKIDTVRTGKKKVIDLCSYSEYTLYLLNNHTMVREDLGKRRTKIKSKPSLPFIQIDMAGGYLLAIANGQLYTINDDSLETNTWNWSLCSWAPHNIVFMSTTHDGSFLWLSTPDNGFLYRSHAGEYTLMTESHSPLWRIYGMSYDTYYEFNYQTCKGVFYPDHKRIENACRLTIGYDNELTFLTREDRWLGIKLIKWQPKYF